jgi:hypothetical protein
MSELTEIQRLFALRYGEIAALRCCVAAMLAVHPDRKQVQAALTDRQNGTRTALANLDHPAREAMLDAFDREMLRMRRDSGMPFPGDPPG